jgi:spore maturation protein CgeB
LKITIFGLTISSSWGNGHATPYRAILRALKRMGHDVVFYERDVAYYGKRRDLPAPDFCRLVLYPDWNTVRPQALRDARDSDVIVNASYCSEGARIVDETLPLSGPLHVFYDLDTPITLTNLQQGDVKYLRRDQVPAFDLYLSFTGGKILDELRQRWGAREAQPLYGCVDPDVHHHVPVPQEYRCLMSYMGTYAADRQEKFERLFLDPVRQRSDARFVLAGSLYPWDWPWPENLRRFEHVSPADHPALYSGSKFTLNLTRDGMARAGYCPSGRFFEAASCGTPIISDSFEGLDHFFACGEEIVVVNNTDDVLAALSISDGELDAIARRARERTLAEHTGEVRAQQLLAYFNHALSNRTASPLEIAS